MLVVMISDLTGTPQLHLTKPRIFWVTRPQGLSIRLSLETSFRRVRELQSPDGYRCGITKHFVLACRLCILPLPLQRDFRAGSTPQQAWTQLGIAARMNHLGRGGNCSLKRSVFPSSKALDSSMFPGPQSPCANCASTHAGSYHHPARLGISLESKLA
jgi:hypothetical protein